MFAASLLRPGLPIAGTAADAQRRPALILCGLWLPLIAGGFAFSSFSLDWGSFLLPLVAIGCAWLGGLYLEERGLRLAGGIVQACTLSFSINIAGLLGSMMLAATAAPFADALLLRADVLLFFGFRWVDLARVLDDQIMLMEAASIAYSSLSWQPPLLIGALFLAGRRPLCWHFLSAWSVCLLLTLAIFPFFPALGGFLHFGIPPVEAPGVLVPSAWAHVEVLQPLRDGSLRHLGFEHLEGVITFPSFHAAGAVLLGWGWCQLGPRLAPMVLLNAAMFASSVLIGGHYLVDVAAGAGLALISIRLAARAHAAAPEACPRLRAETRAA